ncbi:MAG: cobalamin-dependent protein [Bdellovibrionota bacterium]
MKKNKSKIILGVTESDAHVVANHLIAYQLRTNGYEVVNLGPCTSVAEFAEAYCWNPDASALVIGSLNGHALGDLKELLQYKEEGKIRCPVILGGNLSVGADKNRKDLEKFFEIGVDVVLDSINELLPALEHLNQNERLVV